MRHNKFRPGLFAAVMTCGGIVALLGIPAVSVESSDDSQDSPKLVVMIVFDQLRGDYLTKWQELFDKDGFGRMQRDGAWFQNCHYPYAYTLTAAGHASMSTGCPPNKHGIIANEWYDRSTRAEVTAISANRYRIVPEALNANEKLTGPAPHRLKQPTAGDGLHKMYQGTSKVVSLSIKDRSAILLAALRATAVYWFNAARGLFVTSSYYRDTPHAWITEFNKERSVDKYFGKDWTKIRTDLDYQKFSSRDDVACEGTGYKQGQTFPHTTTGGLKKPGANYYEAMTNSPAGNEVLLDLAKRAIEAEKLGLRDAPDLLCISFSSNDLIGHCWGPDSQEVLDITLRSDHMMRDFLGYLDAKVGKDRYVVVISADHGVGPIPEMATLQGKEGGRVSPTLFTTKASAHLQQTFAEKQKALPWIEKSMSGWIYLNHAACKEAGVPVLKAEQELAQWLAKQPGIQAAYGRSQLGKGPLKDDPIGETVRLSYHADCSGDVAIVLKPYQMISGAITDSRYDSYRTTHGTPHFYDTHVPLLVFGAGVKPGVRQERVTPMAAASIVAHALGVPPPSGAEYPLPDGLFK